MLRHKPHKFSIKIINTDVTFGYVLSKPLHIGSARWVHALAFLSRQRLTKALSSHWLGGSMCGPLWTQRMVISSAYVRFCSSCRQTQKEDVQEDKEHRALSCICVKEQMHTFTRNSFLGNTICGQKCWATYISCSATETHPTKLPVQFLC